MISIGKEISLSDRNEILIGVSRPEYKYMRA